MASRCEKHGQVEIGIIEFQGREFAALGASVHGRHVAAYTHTDGRGRLTLRSWCGRTMLDCRSETVGEYRRDLHEPVALVFALTGGRYIVGYALDDSGGLFRGELTECADAEEAAREARALAEHWWQVDSEDDERFQEECRLEDEEEAREADESEAEFDDSLPILGGDFDVDD